ncbi:fructosamine kinase family protein [Georgenia sp. MJ206]|uniref:fructosamine kinase family protein n=1 Tax=Georgenia wangjunii TaxID=3117730 RepID=UPI002F263EF8
MSPRTVRKEGPPGAIAAEVAGLRWLAGAEPDGGARVVRVAGTGPGWLETAHVAQTAPDAAAAEAFGRSLARTHAAGAPAFGSAPPGAPAEGVMGAAPLPWHRDPADARATWGEFYAAERLLPYLADAVGNASLDVAGARVVERCAARVADGRFDAPQPALVHGPAARLHGDLWSGNVLWAARGSGAEAVLIDPAAHGGHAESDLAQLIVFGAPHEERIRAAYDEISPFANGWRERVGLHQLHMLLVHAALFGGGYGERTIDVARRYA